MSEINEEFLIEDNVDFDDIELADEEALLQDEDDILNLNETPDDETLTDVVDAKAQTDNDEERGSRKDKFATERQRITAPEPSHNEKANNKNSLKTRGFNNNRSRGQGWGRRGRYQQNNNQSRIYPVNQGMQYNQGNLPGRNKTVLINPRFQGVVHVNNNARLAWDAQCQNYPSNNWLPNPQMNENAPAPPQSHMQGFQPQGLQYQSPPSMQTLQGPCPFVNQGLPINQGLLNQPPTHFNQGSVMNQPPVMQNMGFPPPQNNVMQSGFGQPNFMRPPPVNQGYGPPNFPPSGHLPAAHPYWERMNPVGFPQYPAPQGHNTYIHFESPPLQSMNMPPPQYNPHPTFKRPVQSNPQPFKGKMVPVEQFQRKKRLIHERLGTIDSNVKVRKFMVTQGDRQTNRIVKELSVTSVTKVQIEEDSETRDLRLKIEEQKRKREEVLKWKEARRLENLKGNPGQVELNFQQPKPFHAVQRSNIVQVKNRVNQLLNRSYQQPGGRTPVLRQVKQIEEQQQQNVVKLAQDSTASEVDVELDQKHLNNFLAGRKVLVKDETLPATRRVMIKNLSTNTGDKKLFQICKSIGEVQNLHRDNNDRHAIITFKSVASAHAFFKKYQRHMLDLSMIEVSLTSDTDGQDGH